MPVNPLSARPTKWPVFDHFVGLALKGLNKQIEGIEQYKS